MRRMALSPAGGSPPWAALPAVSISSQRMPRSSTMSWFSVGAPSTRASGSISPSSRRKAVPSGPRRSSSPASTKVRLPRAGPPRRAASPASQRCTAAEPLQLLAPSPWMRPSAMVAAKGSLRQAARSPAATVSMCALNTRDGAPAPSVATRLAIGGVRIGMETAQPAASRCAAAAAQIARVSPGGVVEGMAISSARSVCSASPRDPRSPVTASSPRRRGRSRCRRASAGRAPASGRSPLGRRTTRRPG